MPVGLLLILALPAAIALEASNAGPDSRLAWIGWNFIVGFAYALLAAWVTYTGIAFRRSAAQRDPRPSEAPTPLEPGQPFVIQSGERDVRRTRQLRLTLAESHRVFDSTAYTGAFLAGALASTALVVSPNVSLGVLGAAAAWVILWWPSRMRTHTLTSSIVIARDPATVFEFISDSRNSPRYHYMFDLSVEKLSSAPIGRGTQFRSRITFRKNQLPGVAEAVSRDDIEEIVEFEANRRVVTKVLSGSNDNLSIITFQEVPGGTLVTVRSDYVHGYGHSLLGVRLRRGRTNHFMKETRAKVWQRAKEILESEPVPTA